MSAYSSDTIAAIATPPGKGGVGVIRVSGGLVPKVVDALLQQGLPARTARFLPFLDQDGSPLDSGLALYFPGPRSFTGEDVLELHGHGSPVVLDLLLARIISLGVRMARPGEFSERAFLNGKIDLTQAEAIADLIDSGTSQAARSAQRSLQGEFSQLINHLLESLIELRIFVEAAIDFVDEEIDFLSEFAVREKLEALVVELQAIQRSANQGRVLRDGLNVVIAGRPNAGKSSLLNALSGRDAAIVTPVAGTTRDLLREHIQIDGMPLHVIDTAGLREGADLVEQEGIRRAHEAIAKADLILLLLDDSRHDGESDVLDELPAHIPLVRVRNKIDLTRRSPGLATVGLGVEISVSIKTGEGLEALRQHLKQCAGYDSEAGHVFTARRRHLSALQQAQTAIHAGLAQLAGSQSLELLAEDQIGRAHV